MEYITNKVLNADDIDILIPQIFLTDKWNEFKSVLIKESYTLVDEHEHTFVKNDILYSYASLEELYHFAQIDLKDIKLQYKNDVPFKLLTLEQYLKVYKSSIKDGYRINVRKKKDAEKMILIENIIKKQKEKQVF